MRTRYKIGYFSLLYCALFLSLFFSLAALNAPAMATSAAPSEQEASDALASQKGQNFLLLGIDGVSKNSDVIMLAHIDEDGKDLKLLQIPRDSYAASHGKINSVFAKAASDAVKSGKSEKESHAIGARALSAELSLMLGIKVDHYAVLTLQNFRTLVDDVGGVPITLPHDLDYDDPAQGLSIHLKAGEQTLDGKAAEGLVRCRNAYFNADYGRMDAQKLFLSAFFQKIKYQTSPIKLLSLIRKAHGFVNTDISLASCLSLGRTLLSAKSENLLFATLAGSTLKLGSGLYEILPEESVRQASLWIEGEFSKENAKKACAGSNQKALAVYQSPAERPFSPRSAKEK